MKYRVKAGTPAPEAALRALRSALVTKKNRYEEVLNYRLIAGGFWRASGRRAAPRRLHNDRIYVQPRDSIKTKMSVGGAVRSTAPRRYFYDSAD